MVQNCSSSSGNLVYTLVKALKLFLLYLDLDVTAYWVCEIHCLALDGFELETVYPLSSKEEKSRQSRDSDLGLLGGKQE